MTESDNDPEFDSNQEIARARSEVAGASRLIEALFHATSLDVKEKARADLARWYCESTVFRYYQVESFHEWILLFRRLVRSDEAIRNFAVAFLEVDPYHFKSGYLKAELLRRLRNCPMPTSQRARLLAVVRDAVMRRPWREYREYCRLAARIADDDLLRDLEGWSACAGAFASRARMMLEFVRQESRARPRR